jgi:Kef-type K+ transport system membrane component KefB
MKKSLLIYVLTLCVLGAGIALILWYGSGLNYNRSALKCDAPPIVTAPIPSPPAESETALAHIRRTFSENAQSTLSIMLLQLIVITLGAKLFGRLFQRLAQPSVIGEMVAGILLGPSFLGLLSPSTMSFLFPEHSLGALRLLSQLGVIIFIFTVGMELNTQHLREKAHSAIIISHVSIIVPFFLGLIFSLSIYHLVEPKGTSFVAFALFIGVAMSITAFPVLARILEEGGLSKTYVGMTAIVCAAVDDVTAWCLLALVVAVSKSAGFGGLLVPILFSLLFAGAMLYLVKPQLERIVRKELNNGKPSTVTVTAVLALVFACAWFTEIIGIHALFGGFLAGIIMPSAQGFRSFLKQRLETFSSSLLLPLFFAFTGLRMQIDYLNDWQSWLLGAGIIVVAITGKLGGSALAARWTGMSWSDSLSVGALMNTRGLVELIVLNIGYDLGILPARIFSMMVLMALITTCMAGPLLSLITRLKDGRRAYLNPKVSVGLTTTRRT